jgi:hypothetical protein
MDLPLLDHGEDSGKSPGRARCPDAQERFSLRVPEFRGAVSEQGWESLLQNGAAFIQLTQVREYGDERAAFPLMQTLKTFEQLRGRAFCAVGKPSFGVHTLHTIEARKSSAAHTAFWEKRLRNNDFSATTAIIAVRKKLWLFQKDKTQNDWLSQSSISPS